jgi:hypothetical protein
MARAKMVLPTRNEVARTSPDATAHMKTAATAIKNLDPTCLQRYGPRSLATSKIRSTCGCTAARSQRRSSAKENARSAKRFSLGFGSNGPVGLVIVSILSPCAVGWTIDCLLIAPRVHRSHCSHPISTSGVPTKLLKTNAPRYSG